MSLVVPSLNEGANLRRTIESVQETAPEVSEIIVVDNGSTDGSGAALGQDPDSRLRVYTTEYPLGVARARNYGAARATGQVLVFADAHTLFQPGWLPPLLELLRRDRVGLVIPAVSSWDRPDVAGYGMSWRNTRLELDWLPKRLDRPYVIPLAPGGCLAVRAPLFQVIGGFDDGMVGYGSEDIELSLRVALLGYDNVVVPSSVVSHLFRASAPYSVDWTQVVYNMLRLIYAHFDTDRIGRVLAEIHTLPRFFSAFELLHASNIWTRRRALERSRARSDTWFLERFGLTV